MSPHSPFSCPIGLPSFPRSFPTLRRDTAVRQWRAHPCALCLKVRMFSRVNGNCWVFVSLTKDREKCTCTPVHVLPSNWCQGGSIVRCPRQLEVLEFIRQGKRVRGYPPSLGDIAKQFGFSRNAARQHCEALVVKGLLAKDPYKGHYLPLDDVARNHEISVAISD